MTSFGMWGPDAKNRLEGQCGWDGWEGSTTNITAALAPCTTTCTQTHTHTHKHPRLVVDVERGVVINAAEV